MTDRSPTRRHLLLAASAMALARPARAAAPRLRIGMSAPATTIDPHLQTNAPNNAVASHLFDTLIMNDAQSRSTPGLAVSWRALDDTHWQLALRQGVRFTDGSPFTAADAIASFRRAKDMPGNIAIRTYLRTIKDMTAPDPGTVVVETTGPDPLLPNSLSRIRVVPAKYQEASTADFNSGLAAVGTGPFRFREYSPGSHVALVRNDDWWGPKVPWPDVMLRMVTDPGSRLASLLAGDLDIIEDVPAQGRDRVRADPGLHLISGVSSRVVYFGMDQARDVSPFIAGKDGKPLDRNPLKDARVRQALSMSINRTAIVERVMEGNAVVAAQFLPPGGAGIAPDLQPTAFDPEAAKRLLAAAGYADGFRLTIHGPNNRYVNDGRIVQAVAQMFNRIGVDTQVEVMPWAVYFPRSVAHEFSVFLGAWGVNTGETSNPLSALVASDDGSGLGVANDGRYSNPAVDRPLKLALRTMDGGARNALLAEACGVAFRDAAILPLHHEVSVWAARKPLTYATRADQYTLAVGVGQSE